MGDGRCSHVRPGSVVEDLPGDLCAGHMGTLGSEAWMAGEGGMVVRLGGTLHLGVGQWRSVVNVSCQNSSEDISLRTLVQLGSAIPAAYIPISPVTPGPPTQLLAILLSYLPILLPLQHHFSRVEPA